MPFKRLAVVCTTFAVALSGIVSSPAGAQTTPSATPTSSTSPIPPASSSTTCKTGLPKIRKKYLNKVPKSTKQLVIVEGRSMKSFDSKLSRWEKRGKCWIKLSTNNTFNGARGWAPVPWTGGQRTPIGTYALTDAGGRLRNPGTKMRYHHGPQAYGAGGYKMSNAKLQIFDFVVAINYNRKAGTTPRANKVLTNRKASGYWFHVRRSFPTRGCVSMSRPNMKQLTRWLDPKKRPYTIQGPKKSLYS